MHNSSTAVDICNFSTAVFLLPLFQLSKSNPEHFEVILPQRMIIYQTVLSLSAYSDDCVAIKDGVVLRGCNLDMIYVCV